MMKTPRKSTLPKFLVKRIGEDKVRELMDQPVSKTTAWRRNKAKEAGV
jgi:hypothetical protein